MASSRKKRSRAVVTLLLCLAAVCIVAALVLYGLANRKLKALQQGADFEFTYAVTSQGGTTHPALYSILDQAKEAGAAAIVVSNHGGRVLDQCPATAEVLPEIAEALKGSGVKVLVDGGIRSGVDVFKALALGADAVLIARPFVTAVYGGGEEGVKCYIDKIAGELADTMQMCGAHSLSEITRDMVRV